MQAEFHKLKGALDFFGSIFYTSKTQKNSTNNEKELWNKYLDVGTLMSLKAVFSGRR